MVLFALGAWALASPVGASPDEDYHVNSIWCAQGIQEGVCEPGSTGPTTRLLPDSLQRKTCYAFYTDISAACQWEKPVTGKMINTDRGNYNGNSYPPVFYWVNSMFVSGDVTNSVIAMRIFNALVYLGLVVALYLVVPAGLRRALIGSALITAVPLGMFVIPSVNPSSWAMLSAATLLIATVGFMRADDRRRRIILGVLAGIALLVGAGARGDAAVYAVVSIAAAVLLTVRRAHLTRLVYPAVLVAAAGFAFLSSGHAAAANPNPTDLSAPLTVGQLFRVAINVPVLWTGGMGQWGLGWLDTNMPAFVWFGSWSVFIGVLVVAMTGARPRRQLAFGLVALAALAIPTYVVFVSRNSVGGIQPRYLLPLLTIAAAAALVRVDGSAFRLTRGQRWTLVTVLALANALALHVNMRRYITGTDSGGWDLDKNIEWWWSSVPISPMTLWVLGSAAFAGGITVLTREFVAAAGSAPEQASAAVPSWRTDAPVSPAGPPAGRHAADDLQHVGLRPTAAVDLAR